MLLTRVLIGVRGCKTSCALDAGAGGFEDVNEGVGLV